MSRPDPAYDIQSPEALQALFGPVAPPSLMKELDHLSHLNPLSVLPIVNYLMRKNLEVRPLKESLRHLKSLGTPVTK